MADAKQNEQALRQLQQLPGNRTCFECQARGPNYVDMFTSAFVCEQCAGLLRGFSHRVKSVTMATFNADEVAQLRRGGNEAAERVWLARWNTELYSKPNYSEKQRLIEYLKLKYETKKWYLPPNAATPPKLSRASSDWVAFSDPSQQQQQQQQQQESLQTPRRTQSDFAVDQAKQSQRKNEFPSDNASGATEINKNLVPPKASVIDWDAFGDDPSSANTNSFVAANNPLQQQSLSSPVNSFQTSNNTQASQPTSWADFSTSSQVRSPNPPHTVSTIPTPFPAQPQWTQPSPPPVFATQHPQPQLWASQPSPLSATQQPVQPMQPMQSTSSQQFWLPPQPSPSSQFPLQSAMSQQPWTPPSALTSQPQIPSSQSSWTSTPVQQAPWPTPQANIQSQESTNSSFTVYPQAFSQPRPISSQPINTSANSNLWSSPTQPLQPASIPMSPMNFNTPSSLSQPLSNIDQTKSSFINKNNSGPNEATLGWTVAQPTPAPTTTTNNEINWNLTTATTTSEDEPPAPAPPKEDWSNYKPPEPPTAPIRKMMDRTQKLEELRRVVREQQTFFPDEATVASWTVVDRTKMLRRIETFAAGTGESLMKVLLELDGVEINDAEDRRFRKFRVHEIQVAMHEADVLLKRVQRLQDQHGVKRASAI